MNHQDATGIWAPADARLLKLELAEIRDAFRQLPPLPFDPGRQSELAQDLEVRPTSLHESFYDIDGVPLLDRLVDLSDLSDRKAQPIWFQ